MNHEESRTPIERSWDERWLDEALTSYAAAEPRAGLETRILAKLDLHALRRQRRWTFAFAAAAAVMLMALVVNLRHAKNGNAPNLASEARISGPKNPLPDMGSNVTARFRKTNGHGVHPQGMARPGNKPNAEVTPGQSAPDSKPSGSEQDHTEVAQQESSTADGDRSAETSSSDVVAQEESMASSGASGATTPSPQPSMPEIRISGLNIKPIQIQEIISGRTTD